MIFYVFLAAPQETNVDIFVYLSRLIIYHVAGNFLEYENFANLMPEPIFFVKEQSRYQRLHMLTHFRGYKFS